MRRVGIRVGSIRRDYSRVCCSVPRVVVLRAVVLRDAFGDGGFAVVEFVGARGKTVELGDMAAVEAVDLLAERIDLLDQPIRGVVARGDGACGVVHDTGALSGGVGGDGLGVVLGMAADDLGFGFRVRENVGCLPLRLVDHIVARLLYGFFVCVLDLCGLAFAVGVFVHLRRDERHLSAQLGAFPAPLLIFVRDISEIGIHLVAGVPAQTL